MPRPTSTYVIYMFDNGSGGGRRNGGLNGGKGGVGEGGIRVPLIVRGSVCGQDQGRDAGREYEHGLPAKSCSAI